MQVLCGWIKLACILVTHMCPIHAPSSTIKNPALRRPDKKAARLEAVDDQPGRAGAGATPAPAASSSSSEEAGSGGPAPELGDKQRRGQRRPQPEHPAVPSQ
jgi:hypothetical protein